MRTHYCNQINEQLLEKEVILCGWVKNKKIFKNLIFIELRDISGFIQLICYKNNSEDLFNKVLKLRYESCIKISGIVSIKFNNTDNIKLFEIKIKTIKILNNSDILPIDLNKEISEINKLKFRYLYLRNSEISNILKIKSKIIWNIHNFMYKNNFLNIETPILSRVFTGGSRNYIVPSRLYNNKYYSLSESPQIFKQILMISGYDKYYQIAKCFRDEDLRSDRQPEFTQIDIETSFNEENYIYKISEKLFKYILKKINNNKVYSIKKITFKESMERFGSDKPDLRNPLEILNISNLINKRIDNKIINMIHIPNGISYLNANDFNKFNEITKLFISDIKNINFIFNNLNLNNCSYKKIYSVIISKTKNINNDLFIINVDEYNKSINIMGKIRIEIGIKMSLINHDIFSLVWIKDFPMFKFNNQDGNIESMHHPFTSPKNIKDINEIINNPMSILSKSYDLIVNGYELASGSVRINNVEIQKTIFNILKISKKDQEKNFGFFLDSLKYGTPPHSGIAFGLERLVMLITKTNNIKDVIAFPKNSSSCDLMTNSPDYL